MAAITESRLAATPSITVLASRSSGMVVAMTSSPCPRHSAAMAFANFSVGNASAHRAGVLTGLPSSSTQKPPSPGATDTVL